MIIDLNGREFTSVQSMNRYYTSKTAVFTCIAVRSVFKHVDAPFQMWSVE